MGTSLYSSCRTWLGQLPGGLCIATIIACAVFAAVTAFPWASIMAVGAIALPEMARYKYDKKMALGSIAAGSELGDLIPPSSMFIVYGMMTGTSIGTLLISGIMPGLLMAGLYVIVILIWCKVKPNAGPRSTKTSAKEKLIALKDVGARSHPLRNGRNTVGTLYAYRGRRSRRCSCIHNRMLPEEDEL